MQQCHHVWRSPKNCDLPVCLCLLFSLWAQDFLSILTTTSCFFLHDLNCKQENLKTRAADPATEKKLEDSVRDPKSEFENEQRKSEPLLKHLHRPVSQKPNQEGPEWDLVQSHSLSLMMDCHSPAEQDHGELVSSSLLSRVTCQVALGSFPTHNLTSTEEQTVPLSPPGRFQTAWSLGLQGH